MLHFPAATDPLRFWARQAPGRTALVERATRRRFSYAALHREAERWAALLRAEAVVPGDRVATLALNRAEHVALFFACGRVGAALVPLNWRLAPAELLRIVSDAAPRIVFGEQRFRSALEPALSTTPAPPRWIDLDTEVPALLTALPDGAIAPERAVDPEEPWLVLYTSGSTGSPKGALLPQRQILFNALATSLAWELGPDDVAPVATPFFHTGGWNVFALPLWLRGGTVVLFDHFDPDDLLAAMAEEGCTVALTVPTQLHALAECAAWGRPLPRLRFLISGGAPCPASLAERARAAGYRFREGYGLTECGPNCFAISDEEALRRPGSVGWPVPWLEARLVDAEGHEVPRGAVGELLLRGPQRFSGYLNQPERTAEALAPGGWLRTGDLARQDAEGSFSICGRRKEMYISGAENVFPGEVEAVLADHPAVAEVVVIGVPDARWGEVGRAYIAPRAGATPEAEALLAFARARLAGYKVPKSICFLDEIPRLGSGKPDRARLATLLLEDV